MLLVCVTAQVPNPNRAVHPGIADPATGLTLRASPLFAVPNGKWDHGEGFQPNDQNDEDFGGWFANDDGSGLEIDDVHPENPTAPWSGFGWNSPDFPGSPVGMLRLEGWLRPAGTDQAISHPLYGNVGPYVDQGAFEAFMPQFGPSAGQKIAIILCTRETTGFPRNAAGQSLAWRQINPGIFSPDGLERWEKVPAPGQQPWRSA